MPDKKNFKPRGARGNQRSNDRASTGAKSGQGVEELLRGALNGKGKSGKNTNMPRVGKNDPAWYVFPGQISKDIAALPFGHLEGASFTFNGGRAPATSHAPAVGVVSYHSVVDSECTAVNGATQAARALYTWVRHQNAGHTNYDAPDLGMYILAANECVKIATYCKRLLKIFNTYTLDSRVLPVQLLKALGLSSATITSMQNEIPSFRGRVNLFIRTLSQFAFPSDVTLFTVQNHLLKDVFVDTNSMRRQYYIFEPLSWLKFNPTRWPTGSALERVSFELSNYTSLLTLMDDFDNILDALSADEDINIMSGDILKAYRANNRESELFSFTEASDFETLDVVYDNNVLKRLHNAMIMGDTLSYGDVVQSSVGIIHSLLGGRKVAANSGIAVDATTGVQTTPVSSTFMPTVADNDYTNWGAAGLDTTATLVKEQIYDDDEIPSSDDLIERTRWMVQASGVTSLTELGGTGTWYRPTDLTHGTEIIDNIFYYGDSISTGVRHNGITYVTAQLEVQTAFRHFPVLYYMSPAATDLVSILQPRFIAWFDVYTFIPHSQLQLINRVVMFTELSVQSVMRVLVK